MCKFSEYRNLSKNVRKSRSEMRAAEVKITSYQKEYFLDEPERYYMDACINKFERVYGICLDPNAYDEHGDFTKNCALFNTEPCINTKCPMFARNLDYIVARERYESAVGKRREFIRNLFNKKSK